MYGRQSTPPSEALRLTVPSTAPNACVSTWTGTAKTSFPRLFARPIVHVRAVDVIPLRAYAARNAAALKRLRASGLRCRYIPARSPCRHARAKLLAAFSALLSCVAPQTIPTPKATAPAATSAWTRRGMPFRARSRALNSALRLPVASRP